MIQFLHLLVDLLAEVTLSARRGLARLLDPEMRARAEGYHRVLGQLEQARWWLGKKHPIAASMAQHVLDCEGSYTRRYLEEIPRCSSWTWQPPAWIGDISTYRDWLDTWPFGNTAAELAGYKMGSEIVEVDLRRLLSDAQEALRDSEAMREILTRANQDLGKIGGSWTDVRQIEAEAEIARLRARLEISTATNGLGETIPHQPGWPDGISCRDETIRGLDYKVAHLTTQRSDLEGRLRELSAECEDLKNQLHSQTGPRVA